MALDMNVPSLASPLEFVCGFISKTSTMFKMTIQEQV
jgi:hypothetical protein